MSESILISNMREMMKQLKLLCTKILTLPFGYKQTKKYCTLPLHAPWICILSTHCNKMMDMHNGVFLIMTQCVSAHCHDNT